MSSGPTVAIVGASGYVGKFITLEFIPALKDGRIKELRVITTKRSEVIENFEKDGATVILIDYSKKESLLSAFSGVDVAVSTLGTGPGTYELKTALLDALVEAGVKVYFPSEFGTNHYSRVKSPFNEHPVFKGKRDHFKKAQEKGVKTVAMLCSDIMEATFGKWFGFDTKAEVWTLVGTGDVPVAVSAEKDVGKFTLEAVLKAFADPAQIPDFLEVYSDMRSLKGYAQLFDKVAGRETKLEFTPVDKAKARYEENQEFEYLLQILFHDGAYDYTGSEGNQLLNPGETLWKLRTIEEYAQETNGRPWSDFE